MPTKVTRGKKGSTKPAAKKSNSKPAAKASTNGGGSKRRTAEDVAKLVPKFKSHLKAGGTMRALKQEHGFSDDGPIRAALFNAGLDSKGQPHNEEAGSIDASKAAGKKQVIKLRGEGKAWYALAYLTGLTEPEVKKIVAEGGGAAEGRVRPAAKPKPKTTAKPAAKKPAAKKPAAKKGATRKATAANPS